MQIWGLVVYAFWFVIGLLVLALSLAGLLTWFLVRWLRKKHA